MTARGLEIAAGWMVARCFVYSVLCLQRLIVGAMIGVMRTRSNFSEGPGGQYCWKVTLTVLSAVAGAILVFFAWRMF
jgi:uncharacterized membrane protein HdeD (DUF308 family)